VRRSTGGKMVKYFGVSALALVMGLVGGFVGGVVAMRHAQTITAKEFQVVDQTGKLRAALCILPTPGTAPNCSICDGQAHLVVFDQQGNPVMWPSAGPGRLSPAQIRELLKLLAAVILHVP
jgi:hypothetical protein